MNAEIEFKNISFKYQDDYVLEDFSLKIKKGETVALVGQSGSGKSNFSQFNYSFYDVNKGSIEIDGNNVKEISKNSLRRFNGSCNSRFYFI